MSGTAIPWMTTAQPASAQSGGTTGSSMVDQWLRAAFAGKQTEPTATNTSPDPTAGYSTGLNAQGQITGAMSQADLQRWADYFGSGAGGTSSSSGGNQLVQTGTSWSPAIPWLTSGARQSGVLQSVGIQSGSNDTQFAANVANSQYAGSDPSNPYYREILNQVAAGNFQPTYTQVQTKPTSSSSDYAQLVGGQLYGNPTPEEQQLLQYFQGAGAGGDVQSLPGLVKAALASTKDTSQSPGQQTGSLQAQAAAGWNYLHPGQQYNPAYDYGGQPAGWNVGMA